ncbi:MAG: hypothetical protein QW721_01970 [Desulfurococcaceae archaeon]
MGRRPKTRKTLNRLAAMVLIALLAAGGVMLGILAANHIMSLRTPEGRTPEGNIKTIRPLSTGGPGEVINEAFSIVFRASAALESIIPSLQPHSISLEFSTAKFYVDSPIVEVVIAIIGLAFGIVLALGLYKRVMR